MSVHITERLAVRDRFRATLIAAQDERGQRPDLITQPDGSQEFGWVLHERQQMFALVNQVRAERGLPPAEMDQVERVEQMACGHVDYTAKYSLYCTEIALGEREPRP